MKGKYRNAAKVSATLSSQTEGGDDSNNPQVFRGFVGGSGIVTKKGFRGLKIDSLWVQNLFTAFENDDVELANSALQSSLADLNDTVIGGQYGTPYSIGDYGFYVKEQFEKQAEFLSENERLVSQGKQYLSEGEWKAIDDKLSEFAHYSTAKYTKTCRGDSFAALAVRRNAFEIAKLMMDSGIDPLIVNEKGDDLFVIIKQQYNDLGIALKDIQEFKALASESVVVPSQVEAMFKHEDSITLSMENLSVFCDSVKANLIKRLAEIEKDVILQRRCQLRNEVFPQTKIWNIAQKDKATLYIQECDDLKHYAVERLSYHKAHSSDFQNLADMLQEHLDNIRSELYQDDDDSTYNGSYDDAAYETASNASTIHSIKSQSRGGRQTSSARQLTIGNLDSSSFSAKEEGKRDQFTASGKGNSNNDVVNRAKSFKDSFDDFTTISKPRTASPMTSVMGSTVGSVRSYASSQQLTETELFYKKLGIKKNDFKTSNSKNKNTSSALISAEPVTEYAPVLGVLRESDTEVILYR